MNLLLLYVASFMVCFSLADGKEARRNKPCPCKDKQEKSVATVYWSPDKMLADNGRVKRDSNGDRI
jgi:hypothetical protein